ncbi:magnesium and cobalt transport protein CorA [Cellulomonas sp. HZM]|uniref:magnesium and cobalt transport protein CorA n=1 Tax=Cellulomonas sp. HZM TaxID=1454010 RepID=UPI00068FFEEB|nr:magnesium and cobalt transport protein CorA [Cellulomonas sp. HZM]
MSDERTYAPGKDGWAAGDGTPVWVVVDPDDLERVARERGFSEQALRMLAHHRPAQPDEDAPPPGQRERRGRESRERSMRLRGHVDRTADQEVVLSVPTVSYVPRSRDVLTGGIVCVVSNDVVVTAEVGDADVLGHAVDKLCDGVPIPDEGVRQVLAAVLLTLVANAADVEAELGDAVSDTEQVIFSSERHDDPVQRIYDLKREIAEARRALGPVTVVLPQLEDPDVADRRRRSIPSWLRRTQQSADRLDRHLDGHDKLLDAMLSVHLSQVSVRQNEDMRKISAWAAIAAVPTLVAGVYGMNFRHMPELTWTYGYPLALALMLGLCVGLYRLFRRSGWL